MRITTVSPGIFQLNTAIPTKSARETFNHFMSKPIKTIKQEIGTCFKIPK